MTTFPSEGEHSLHNSIEAWARLCTFLLEQLGGSVALTPQEFEKIFLNFTNKGIQYSRDSYGNTIIEVTTER